MASDVRWFRWTACLACLVLAASASPNMVRQGQCPLKMPLDTPSDWTLSCRNPHIDAKLSESWAPWTHRPACLNGTNDVVLSSSYCAYTADFFGNYGLSIITQPKMAESIARLVLDIYESSFPSPATVRRLNTNSAYAVVDVPPRGKGVVATRRIQKLETFMVDYPSLMVDMQFPAAGMSEDRSRLLTRAAEQLADPQSGILRLARSRTSDHQVVEDVMGSNSFATTLAGSPYKVIYPIITRINHACAPNAFMRSTADGLTAGVAALRDIEPGEEINISYIPTHLPSDDRQALLRDGWAFACECALCRIGAGQREASDRRRRRIVATRDKAVAALKAGQLRLAETSIYEFKFQLDKEGLPPHLTELFHSLAKIYWAIGRKEEAERFMNEKLDILDDYHHLDHRNRSADLEAVFRSFGEPKLKRKAE